MQRKLKQYEFLHNNNNLEVVKNSELSNSMNVKRQTILFQEELWSFNYEKPQLIREIQLDLSPINFAPSNSMELETTGTPSVQEYELSSDFVGDRSLKASKSAPNYSKDSLKFCRRLAPAFLKLIEPKGSIFVERFLESTIGILVKQAEILEAFIVTRTELKTFIQDRIVTVWRSFALELCSSRNKKISKISKKRWDTVFTYDGFWEALQEDEMDLSSKFISKETAVLQIMTKLLKKLIFFTNRGIVLTFLFQFKLKDWVFREKIKTFDNYLILCLVPELFEFYNHTRGIFVDQCCGACKVCGSKMINEKVLLTIQQARKSAESFKSFLCNMQLSPKLGETLNPLGILQFFASQDSEFLREQK